MENKVKYVYVLVSSEKDYFYEECFISITSLKKHNPKAEVVVVVDGKTSDSLFGFRSEIKKIADIIVIHMDNSYSTKQLSRLLKISTRKIIKGTFAYIDTDTVIADSLEPLEQLQLEIGMVLDKHERIDNNFCRRNYENFAGKIGVSPGASGKHFNGGFMLVEDKPITHRFFEMWENEYKKCMSKGVDIDQTSLNAVNAMLNGVITELDGIWNVQLDSGLRYISEGKILHYSGYQPSNVNSKYYNNLPYKLCNVSLLEDFRSKGKISEDINEIIEYPKRAFKTSYIIPNDCIAYPLLFSNHFRMLKFLYVRAHGLFRFFEKIYSYLFLKIFKRP